MDKRRMNTAQVIEAGILNITPPKSSVPKKFKCQKVDEGEWTEQELKKGLKAGGLTASTYYGCWDIWKTKGGFSGQLMQYRAITDEFKNQSTGFALEKAIEWATNCQE